MRVKCTELYKPFVWMLQDLFSGQAPLFGPIQRFSLLENELKSCFLFYAKPHNPKSPYELIKVFDLSFGAQTAANSIIAHNKFFRNVVHAVYRCCWVVQYRLFGILTKIARQVSMLLQGAF